MRNLWTNRLFTITMLSLLAVALITIALVAARPEMRGDIELKSHNYVLYPRHTYALPMTTVGCGDATVSRHVFSGVQGCMYGHTIRILGSDPNIIEEVLSVNLIIRASPSDRIVCEVNGEAGNRKKWTITNGGDGYLAIYPKGRSEFKLKPGNIYTYELRIICMDASLDGVRLVPEFSGCGGLELP